MPRILQLATWLAILGILATVPTVAQSPLTLDLSNGKDGVPVEPVPWNWTKAQIQR